MKIDISLEKLIPLSKVPDLAFVPRRRNGRPLHRATPYRWSTTGVRGIKLETVQFAGTRCTTMCALRQFIEQLSSPMAVVGSPQETFCVESISDVDEGLDKAGI